MNYRSTRRLRLSPRNEGKIKSFESCSDIRAWSTDPGTRDRYLRDWMIGDMPRSVLSVRTLLGFLQTNSARNCKLATPLCHPDCISKVVLDSIIESCGAMKECLKIDEKSEKYFDEEELETGNWPCERCLDALKSIKMFWKVIVERILNTKLPKHQNQMVDAQCGREDSVRKLAHIWQDQIVSEACYTKNLESHRKKEICLEKSNKHNIHPIINQKGIKIFLKDNNGNGNKERNKNLRPKSLNGSVKNSIKCIDKDFMSEPKNSHENLYHRSIRPSFKVNRYTSVKIRTSEIGCDPHHPPNDSKEVVFVKSSVDCLKDRYKAQKSELETLRKENALLKMGLKKLMESKNSEYAPDHLQENASFSLTEFERDEKYGSVPTSVNTDSEMIITLKNCKNTKYRHVSLLQVLHKTNEPKFLKDLKQDDPFCKKEDPIKLLQKVKNTVGEIVRREIDIANEKMKEPSKFDVNASYQCVGPRRRLTKHSSSSVSGCDSNFISLTG